MPEGWKARRASYETDAQVAPIGLRSAGKVGCTQISQISEEELEKSLQRRFLSIMLSMCNHV